MFIERKITNKLLKLASEFPALAIFGPRQSGKTTLVKHLFKNYEYFSFEEMAKREIVSTDPKAFLEKYKDSPGLIFDEVQHVPHLLSYMQTHIDTHKKKGHFILTGSQNLLLNEKVTQSLAGRIAITTLLPLSIQELKDANLLTDSIDKILFLGLYPSIYSDNVGAYDWYSSYINTYVERDVRQIQNIGNLSQFQKFMQLCAGRVGQILNLSSFADDLGVSVPTVKQWLSILEATYIIFLLQPYYQNFNKRIIKAPKLYFYDPGIVCSLLNISNADQLFSYPLRGSIFESIIISDFKKQYYNLGKKPNCYFWRDQSQYEIDCIIETVLKRYPIEIKTSSTYNSRFLDHLSKWNTISDSNPKENILIYSGDNELNTDKGKIINWRNSGNIIENLND